MCKNLKRHYIHGMTNILVLWEMQPLVETSDIFFPKNIEAISFQFTIYGDGALQ